MTHSLLTTSVTLDRVNREICQHKTTYRHGAQVKDVPAISRLILRRGVSRRGACRRRLLRTSDETPPRLLSDSVEPELS